MQENWIGKSQGLQFCFRLAYQLPGGACDIEVFTTRPDTIFGASFVAISPGHPIAEALAAERPEVAEFIAKARAGGTSAAEIETAEKLGFDTGLRGRPPVRSTNWRLPVWIANFVLMDYGTGALFGVPGHDVRDFEFATQISICRSAASSPPTPAEAIGAGHRGRDTDPGVAVNSQFLDGLTTEQASGRGHPPRRDRRLGPGQDPVSPARLGRVAPALLGHADPDHPLRQLRPGRRAARPAAGRPARGRQLRHSRQSARPPPDAGARSIARNAARRRGARPTRSTRSSIRAGISSASPASRTTSRSTAPRPRNGFRSANISAGSSMRSCTCSTPASGPARSSGWARSASSEPFKGLFTQGMVTHETYRERRRPLAQPRRDRDPRRRRTGRACDRRRGPARPRRENVQVEEEHDRPGADPRPLRRRRGALVHAVRLPARARPRMVGRRDRGRGALRPARLAAGRSRRPATKARTRRLKRKVHRTIAAVGEAIEGLQFNKAVAALYELTSAIEKAAAVGEPRRGDPHPAAAGRAGGSASGRGGLGARGARTG